MQEVWQSAMNGITGSAEKCMLCYLLSIVDLSFCSLISSFLATKIRIGFSDFVSS